MTPTSPSHSGINVKELPLSIHIIYYPLDRINLFPALLRRDSLSQS